MEPTAFTWGELLAWWSAFAAAVTALYLLRLRRRPVVVPWLALWERSLADRATERLWTRLRRWISWLLALVAASLLLLALSDPRLAGPRRATRRTVLLLDTSGSMRAREADGASRLDLARREAERWIDALGEGEEMLLVRLDARPRPLAPWTGDRATLRDALVGVVASDLSADLCAAWPLVENALRGSTRPRLVLLTDGGVRAEGCAERIRKVREAGLEAIVRRLGSVRPNVAIGHLAARREPLDRARVGVLLELRNPMDVPRRVELTLRGDGEVVEVAPVELAPGASLRRFYDGLAGVGSRLEATVRPIDGLGDALAEDDRAVALLPERRRLRVLAVTTGNLYLQAALLLDEALEVTEVAPGEALPPWQGFDVAVFDRWVPASPPPIPAFYLRPEPLEGGWSGPIPVRGELASPWFEQVRRRHPVTRWLRLRDVNVARALRMLPRPGDRVLGGAPNAPLLVAGKREGHRFLVLGFDVRESDLPLRVAWPLMLLSGLQWLAEVPPDDASVPLPLGGEAWIRVPSRSGSARLRSPSGRVTTLPVRDGSVRWTPQEAGIYTVEAAGATVRVAATRGEAAEEVLTVPEAFRVGGVRWSESGPEPPERGAPPWVWLVIAAVVLLSLQWWGYQRRWTV